MYTAVYCRYGDLGSGYMTSLLILFHCELIIATGVDNTAQKPTHKYTMSFLPLFHRRLFFVEMLE